MHGFRRCLPMLLIVGGLLFPLDAGAQQAAHTREGFWINFGLGYGTLGCVDCNGREGGMSGRLAVGGTIGRRWLLGAGTTGWTKSVDGATLTASTLTATARFYPALSSGWNGFAIALDVGDANVGQARHRPDNPLKLRERNTHPVDDLI